MKAPEVSSRVSYRIALAGEATTVAENLIKPCAVEMAICVFGEQSNKKFESVQASNNTVNSVCHNLSAKLDFQSMRQQNVNIVKSLMSHRT
jgi:hypothetical protein